MPFGARPAVVGKLRSHHASRLSPPSRCLLEQPTLSRLRPVREIHSSRTSSSARSWASSNLTRQAYDVHYLPQQVLCSSLPTGPLGVTRGKRRGGRAISSAGDICALRSPYRPASAGKEPGSQRVSPAAFFQHTGWVSAPFVLPLH